MTLRKRPAAAAAIILLSALNLPAIPGPGVSSSPPAKDNAADQVQKLEDARRVLEEMTRESDKNIPVGLLERCSGIAIIPDVVKAAFVIGGRRGKGVLLIKDRDGRWSNPAFIRITGGSIGWQAGVESADVILVFKTPRSVENMTRGKFTLGADAGIAAGPLGRSAEASTDSELKAEILAYSRSRGLYAGLSLQGASLKADAKANQDFYGRENIGITEIFEGSFERLHEAAGRLRQALEQYARSKD